MSPSVEPGTASVLRVRLLGDVTASVAGADLDLGGPKSRAVLAVLALDAGRVVSVDRLVELVWGERAPARAEVSLRSYISKLRRTFEEHGGGLVIESRRPGYVLHAGDDAIDVVVFERLVEAGTRLLAAGDAPAALAALDEGLDHWGGPPFGDLAADLDLAPVVARLDARHLEAVEARVDALLALGEHAAAVPDLTAAVADHPLAERLRAQLALALYRSGRQAEALRALDDARRTLADEVGVDPGPELRELEAAILAHDPALAPEPPAAASPMGAPARTTGLPALFGRHDELDALLAAMAAAVGGRGRVAVVSGEPGIGKTRLVEELVARAGELGVVTAWSRCPESAAGAAYWPWSQLARELHEPPSARVGEALAGALAPTPGDGAADAGEADRFRVWAAALDALRATTVPLLLVVDDLQWADSASLGLLEFVAGDLDRLPVCVVVTTRPPAAEPSRDLQDCVAELARTPDPVRLELTGLSAAAVGDWLRERAARLHPDVVAFVHGQSAGNPFFVRELAALLAADGRLDDPTVATRGPGLPAAVQDVVRRRASRVPPTTQQLLATAAVIGRRFDLDVLAGVADLSVDEALDALEPAIDAGLLDADDSRVGRFAFSHALVAETLAGEQRAVRRARIHATTTQVMERLRGTGDDAVTQLAHHALEGAAAGSAAAAVDYSVRAAELATRVHAPADAASQWANARRALEVADPTDHLRREELTYQLGVALGNAGDVAGAHASLAEAARAAEARGDVDATARALAVVHSDDLWGSLDWRETSPDTIALLERTIPRLADSSRRAELLGSLASLVANTGDGPRADALSAEAVELARHHGPPIVLARALLHRFWSTWRLATNGIRTRESAEFVALAESTPDLPARFTPLAHICAFTCAFERGDGTAADHHLARARAACDPARLLALHGNLCWSECAALLVRGRFDDAARHADAMYDAFRRTRAFIADSTWTSVVNQALVERGRIGEFEAVRRDLSDTPYASASEWQFAWAYAAAGDLDRAAQSLARFDGVMGDDWYRPIVVTSGLYAAAALGEREVVERCAAVLRPHAAMVAVTGSGGATVGPIALALAAGDHLLGAQASAEANLAAGLALAEAMGAGPWVARGLALRHRMHGDESDRLAALRIAGELDLAPLVVELGSA